MLSANVKIMSSNGHDIKQEQCLINPNQRIVIGTHVWLADNCIILKVNNIGANSIIGIYRFVDLSICRFVDLSICRFVDLLRSLCLIIVVWLRPS